MADSQTLDVSTGREQRRSDLGAMVGFRAPAGQLFDNFLDFSDINNFILGSALSARPGYTPVLFLDPKADFFVGTTMRRQSNRTTGTFGPYPLKSRLSINSDLTLDSLGVMTNRDQAGRLSSVKANLGVSYLLTPNWSLGASVFIRDTWGFDSGRSRGGLESGWFAPSPLNPANGEMVRAGLEYRNATNTMVALVGHMGNLNESGFSRSSNSIDLRGLGFTLQHSLMDGHLNLGLGATLNYYQRQTQIPWIVKNNLSAWLAMNYMNPSLLNAGLRYRHGSGGYFMTDTTLIPGLGTDYLDAGVWRNFSLTPTLSLSAHLYGSILLGGYTNKYQIPIQGPTLLDSYVEGRMTMNYAF